MLEGYGRNENTDHLDSLDVDALYDDIADWEDIEELADYED